MGRVTCKLINLEEGRPTVNVGLLRLDRALVSARAEGVPLLKVIHGYGSSGVGGRLREEVWKAMEREGVSLGRTTGRDRRLRHVRGREVRPRFGRPSTDVGLSLGTSLTCGVCLRLVG